ncbi:MAG: hypothetical protein RL430_1556 [Actinomycetota bacterium]
MDTTTIPIERLEDALLDPMLHDAVRELLPAMRVFYYRNNRGTERWFIIERDGNVGTVSLGDFPLLGQEHKVAFMNKPNREYGSGLMVRGPDWNEGMDLRQAALIATGPTYSNFATPGRDVPNHGMEHFAWALPKLREIRL